MRFGKHDFQLEINRGVANYYNCPNCKQNTFRRFVFTGTRVQVASDVGECTRKKTCGYVWSPHSHAYEKGIELNPKGVYYTPSCIPHSFAIKTCMRYEENNFAQYLKKEFGEIAASKMTNLYRLGTTKKLKGGTVFWQIDKNNKVRSGKIVCLNSEDGNKQRFVDYHWKWVHDDNDLLKKIGCDSFSYNYVPCFFGEHLLSSESEKPINIVWKETTAIIASHLYPDYVWLSTNENPNLNMTRALSGWRIGDFFPPGNKFPKIHQYYKNY